MVNEPQVRLAKQFDLFDEHGDTTDPGITAAVSAKMQAVLDAIRTRDAAH